MTVKLFTKAGALVHEQVLPPFVESQPDVIVWSGRVFCVPTVDGDVARHLTISSDHEYTYEEAFSYTLDPAQARRLSPSGPRDQTAILRDLVRDASRLLNDDLRELGWGKDVRDWNLVAQPFVRG